MLLNVHTDLNKLLVLFLVHCICVRDQTSPLISANYVSVDSRIWINVIKQHNICTVCNYEQEDGHETKYYVDSYIYIQQNYFCVHWKNRFVERVLHIYITKDIWESFCAPPFILRLIWLHRADVRSPFLKKSALALENVKANSEPAVLFWEIKASVWLHHGKWWK